MSFNVRIIESSRSRSVESLLARRSREQGSLVRRVAQIVEGVRRGGDTALMRFARRFDKLDLPMEVTADEMHAAARHVPNEIFQVSAVPRTLSGKKMELPLKKLLMGTPAEQVFKLDAMANADCVDWFVAFAQRSEPRSG